MKRWVVTGLGAVIVADLLVCAVQEPAALQFVGKLVTGLAGLVF